VIDERFNCQFFVGLSLYLIENRVCRLHKDQSYKLTQNFVLSVCVSVHFYIKREFDDKFN
jgi:hypothetical protein